MIMWCFETEIAITITKKSVIDCNRLRLPITITDYDYPMPVVHKHLQACEQHNCDQICQKGSYTHFQVLLFTAI